MASRALAQRCSEAAGETESLLERAIQSSRRGSELAARVDGNLRGIGERARHLDSLATRLAEDSAAQTRTLDQIQKATAEIGRSGEHASRSSRHSASVAAELNHEAADLEASIQQVAALFLGRSGAESA